MSLGRVLLDSSVFIYAIGAEHRYREPCRQLLVAVAEGTTVTGEASVLAAQELLHQRARRTANRSQAAAAARSVTTFCTLHELTPQDLVLASQLFERTAGLDAADACHAATAVRRGIAVLVSPDAAFDEVVGLRRLDPADAAARL